MKAVPVTYIQWRIITISNFEFIIIIISNFNSAYFRKKNIGATVKKNQEEKITMKPIKSGLKIDKLV